ncbi:aromatic amino acid transport family protein [Francisella sciaenopsi]|uniref:Aromatic amino acid transport family protein n=1 Tax=Francisella sciaenopsi TaxID=3055034 RepID=A0ABQ6PE29_9GAMM
MKLFNLNKFDFEWLSINFGMAIGAGILMVPVSIGIVGLPLFIVAVLITYPGIYLLQRLYIRTLFASKEPKVYSEIIKEVLGDKAEILLSITYLIMMLIWTTIYAEVIAQTFSDYAYSFNLTDNPNIKSNLLVSFLFVIALMLIGFKSQKFLVKSITVFAVILVVAILGITISLAPYWDFANTTYTPGLGVSIQKLIILIPFTLTSILFIQTLSPMTIAYKKHYATDIAEKRAVHGMKVAFIILTLIVISFILSFSMTISHDMAVSAIENNYSGLVLLKKNGVSNSWLDTFGGAINIFAILTSFLSILYGMKNSLLGILFIITKKVNRRRSEKILNLISIICIFLITWSAIVFEYPVYVLLPLCGPIFAIIGCFIPAFIVYRTPSLHHLKGLSLNFVIVVGVILAISPLLTSFLD